MSSALCLFLDRFPVHKSVQWRLYLFHKASTIKSLVNVTLLTPLAEATLFFSFLFFFPKKATLFLVGGGGGGGCAVHEKNKLRDISLVKIKSK